MRRFLVLLLLLPAAALAAAPKVLVLGDSLSAAYGVPLEAGWVALMQQRIRDADLPHEVVNASISGETTAGGLTRLPELLERHRPAVLLLELGGNDGLRGQSVARMRERLTEMVRLAQAAGAEVAIFEMRIPANYGQRYTEAFEAVFAEVAQATGALRVPFFLADIAGDTRWFQDDGIHPSRAAQPRMLEAVWPHVAPLLDASIAVEERIP